MSKELESGDAPSLTPELIESSRQLALRYRLVVERTDSGAYQGTSVELPGVLVRESTLERCAERVIDALAHTIAIMRSRQLAVPSPASEHKRDQQLNVRLTSAERFTIEEAARREGARSIADFVRYAALARSGGMLGAQ
jgi:predicted RNase H-like HicB family nuclease